MADWASRANYNNLLFIIYHTLQFAKHKGMYCWKKEVYRWQRSRLANVCDVTATREHFRYASPTPPSRTGARNVKDGPFCGVLSPRVILWSSACTFCHIGMFCRRIPKNLSLFSSNIVIHLSSSLDVCIGVHECARALCFVVFYYPHFR